VQHDDREGRKGGKTITGHGSPSTTAATGNEIAAEIDATDA
jgi:hypothetical protein